MIFWMRSVAVRIVASWARLRRAASAIRRRQGHRVAIEALEGRRVLSVPGASVFATVAGYSSSAKETELLFIA